MLRRVIPIITVILVLAAAAPAATPAPAKGVVNVNTASGLLTPSSGVLSGMNNTSYTASFSTSDLVCTVTSAGTVTRAICTGRGHTLEISAFVNSNGRGVISLMRRAQSSLPISRTISLGAAAAGDFKVLAPVAEGLPDEFIELLAQTVTDGEKNGTIPRFAENFLLACVGTLQSARGSDHVGGSPSVDAITAQKTIIDYGAYAVCFWACMAGGGGGTYCGELCAHEYL